MSDLSPEAAVGEATTRLTEALADLIVASGRLTGRAAAPAAATLDDNPLLRLYTVAAVAKLVSVGPSYVYDEIKAGRLKKVQLGNGERRKDRIRGSDLASWIDSRYEVPPAVRRHGNSFVDATGRVTRRRP